MSSDIRIAPYESTVIARWYTESVRPFLESEDPERIKELDRELIRLKDVEKSLNKLLSICFVGGSGVGKSTLINALVAGTESVVPSGGVGPLTAQALEINFGESPSFAAIYHPAAKLWNIGFAIERMLGLEQSLAVDESTSEFGEVLDEETVEVIEKLGDSDDFEARSRGEHLRKQAQQIITGNQDGDADLAYLSDGIRECIGKPRKWNTQRNEEDIPRLQRLAKIFNTEHRRDEYIHEANGNSPNFMTELRDHAAGFLAPTIKSLEVWWNSDLLKKKLRLVDLPGLGIAGDVYREVTDKWVRSEAQAVVLVVNYRGITEPDANLLRTSGFLTRFLHSLDDPTADPLKLIVVVVRIDEMADSRRSDDKSKTKRDHLADAIAECKANIKSQIRSRLVEAWSFGSEHIADGKTEAIDRIMSELEIYPVSAVQYRKLLADDEDDPSFLKDPIQSGLPQLSEGLGNMATAFADMKLNRFVESYEHFRSRLQQSINRIRKRWEERDHASQEAEALAAEVEVFLRPLREKFRARQGGFRTFLKETLPAKIDNVILQARDTSQKSIRLYLKGIGHVHWKTLQAAVRREGVFYGNRHVNLPADFAQTFEDPVAEAWSKTILKELRKTTKEHADDCLVLVDEVVTWAKQQGARVQSKAIEEEREAIASGTKLLTTVGKEAVDSLRDTVKEELLKAIEEPIRKKCKKFVELGKNQGYGVKSRIIELFDELADEVAQVAVQPAKFVLMSNYAVVEMEIREVFNMHPDPLASAKDAIVESHESALKRSDAQKRRAKLEAIADIENQFDELNQHSQLA